MLIVKNWVCSTMIFKVIFGIEKRIEVYQNECLGEIKISKITLDRGKLGRYNYFRNKKYGWIKKLKIKN